MWKNLFKTISLSGIKPAVPSITPLYCVPKPDGKPIQNYKLILR